MRGKRSGSIVCVLPHDSVLSALEGEQKAFRALLAGSGADGGSDDVPFSFLPPLLAYPEREIPGTIEIAPPRALDGWIVRPASGFDSGHTIDLPAIDPVPIDLPPGYPALPRGSFLVLGYAGNRADLILDAYLAAPPRECAGTIALRVWRKAILRYEFGFDDATLSCAYSLEAGSWERAKGQ